MHPPQLKHATTILQSCGLQNFIAWTILKPQPDACISAFIVVECIMEQQETLSGKRDLQSHHTTFFVGCRATISIT